MLVSGYWILKGKKNLFYPASSISSVSWFKLKDGIRFLVGLRRSIAIYFGLAGFGKYKRIEAKELAK